MPGAADLHGRRSAAGGRMPGAADLHGRRSAAGGRMPGAADLHRGAGHPRASMIFQIPLAKATRRFWSKSSPAANTSERVRLSTWASP